MLNTLRLFEKTCSIAQRNTRTARNIVFQELPSFDPFQARYTKRMKGYGGKYKIRIGDYRIGITVDKKDKLIV